MKKASNPPRKFVIGVDPGSHKCGYAVMTISGDLVAYGTISNHSRDIVRRIRAMRNGLEAMMLTTGLLGTDDYAEDTLLAYEAPYSGTGSGAVGRSGLQQVWIAIGMLMTLPVEEVMPLHVATVQATWGRKKSMDRKAGKEYAVKLANDTYGIALDPEDSDTADAIWVAATAIRKIKEGK